MRETIQLRQCDMQFVFWVGMYVCGIFEFCGDR